MPDNVAENKPGESWLSKKIVAITAIVGALTGLVTALVHFRDSIPWLTPVNTIELTPNPVNLAIGDKFQVIATVRDANKNPLGKKVNWSIANPALVQVDSDGIVTGNAAGETSITASIGFVKGLAPVHVRRVTVATVDVFPPATTLLVDDHLKFDATPYDREGNSLLGRPVRWASDNNLVAAVDQSSGDTTVKSAGIVNRAKERATPRRSPSTQDRRNPHRRLLPRHLQTRLPTRRPPPHGQDPVPAPGLAASPRSIPRWLASCASLRPSSPLLAR